MKKPEIKLKTVLLTGVTKFLSKSLFQLSLLTFKGKLGTPTKIVSRLLSRVLPTEIQIL